jgi:arachidonate 5-lipoxygenase
MESEDTFFKRLQPIEDFAQLYEKSERFGTWNSKTLGIILVRIYCTEKSFLHQENDFIYLKVCS